MNNIFLLFIGGRNASPLIYYYYFFLCSVIVDPTSLGDGLHYYEVYGIDCKAPWRGPLFRVPITITKPTTVKSRPPIVTFQGMSFQPGDHNFVEMMSSNWELISS